MSSSSAATSPARPASATLTGITACEVSQLIDSQVREREREKHKMVDRCRNTDTDRDGAVLADKKTVFKRLV